MSEPDKAGTIRSPWSHRDFVWRYLDIPWVTDEKWGKLVYVAPKLLRPHSLGIGVWELEFLRGLLELKFDKFSFTQQSLTREWIFDEDLTDRQRNELSTDHFSHWSGWDYLVLPYNFEQRLPSQEHEIWEKDLYRHDVMQLRDAYSDMDESGETPGEVVSRVFNTLRSGDSVLVFGFTKKPSGFLPAAVSMLADPQCHVAKVVYPVRQNYPLSETQVGYLAGYWDAREASRFRE